MSSTAFKVSALGLAAAVAGGLAFAGGAQAQERKVTIVSWGGPFQAAERKGFWEPYAKETGVTVLEDSWTGNLGKIRAQVEANNVTWDIIVADYEHAVIGCEAGILEPIPADVIGDPNDYLPGVNHECGASRDVFAAVMVYDDENRPAAWGGKVPKTIVDAFDTKTFPGKRGIRKRPKNFLEQIIMATGVPHDKVYEVLDQPDGFDRFLKKVDSVKDSLLFYDVNSQAMQLLSDGEVAIVSSFNGRAHAENVKGRKFVIIWDGQLYSTNTVIVPKGPRSGEAMKLLKYMLVPKNIARYSSIISYGPTRPSAMSMVDPMMLPELPSYEKNLKTAVKRNEEWWADHFQEVTEKWNVWLAKL